MARTLAAADVTLRDLKQSFGLSLTTAADFFTEWFVEVEPPGVSHWPMLRSQMMR
ncbi:hypothetical protein XM38_021940 [Halomicronema hongdechloris C2206]|uniref:Uncharacterized protein n=1 Tax=Halomicronema hongdechloris C2206 TaxID=1641165 RepID=A0A1Z3HLP9_9CYAN|nr:hypothetical protein [Halomicronema hongdechloris]ASC71242.1 hypothetical protein XM38_021940 [Halomicronema hongdechloris C2206]